ncbi:MAG: peroxiredoxin-like family protein [Wenzhouxiangellaceae bacterium]
MRIVTFIALLWLSAGAGAVELYDSADEVRPLLPGAEAPAFSLLEVTGERFVVNPAELTKPVVMTFYRGGWCPYCNLHLAELRKAEAELRELGFEVWFISADRPEMLYDSLKEKVDYRLFSDAGLQVASAFGIAFKVDAATVERYQEYGIDLEKASGQEHHGLPAPATFLIGTDGIVQFQYTNPDYRVRLAPSILLAAAKAYQDNAHQRLQRKR